MNNSKIKTTTEATRVSVDNWSIQLPANFIYSTDHSVIDSPHGKERYLIAHYNDSTANFRNIYDSSFNFTVHSTITFLDETAYIDYTIPWITRINTRNLMHGNEVLMATEHVMICYEDSTWIANSQAHHFRFRLFVDNTLYLIQVFFGKCKALNCKGKEQKTKFVLGLLKTIRYKGEENLDYDEINKVDDYNIEPLSDEDYKKESEAALKYLVAETLASKLASKSKIPLCFSFPLTTDDDYDDSYDDDYDDNYDDDNYDDDNYDNDYDNSDNNSPYNYELTIKGSEILDFNNILEEANKRLPSSCNQNCPAKEDYYRREKQLIASGKKRPFKHKKNNLISDSFLTAIKNKNLFNYDCDYHQSILKLYEILIKISELNIDDLCQSAIDYIKENIEAIYNSLLNKENLSHISWNLKSIIDYITDTYYKINNDVSTLDDFKIEDGVLVDYKGTASCVDIPNSVIEIDCGALAYKEQAHITEITIPESVEIINDDAFHETDCTEIFIPKNVKAVAGSAFGGQSLLENITVDENNAFYSSEDGVFYNKDKSVLICYPDGKNSKEFVVPSYVNNIDSRAFSFRDGYLEKITVSGNVKIIECDSFIYNSALKIVILNCGVKSIEKNAFKDCQSLEEIHLPESMERIIINAFTGCKNLKRIYVSDKLENEKVLGNIKKIAEKFGADIIIGNKAEKAVTSVNPPKEISDENAPTGEKSDSVEDSNSTIVNTEAEVPLSKNLEPIIVSKSENELKAPQKKPKSTKCIILILIAIILAVLIWAFTNQDFLYQLDFCNNFACTADYILEIFVNFF